MPNKRCLAAAAKELARRGFLFASALAAGTIDTHKHGYLAPRSNPAVAPSECATAVHFPGRLAVFGVSDPKYLPRYWVTLASLGCGTPDNRWGVDCFVLVDSSASAAGTSAGSATTPSALANLTYVEVDFAASFPLGLSYHAAWPSVAYWWVFGPEIFRAAGYEHALYVDGDVMAVPPSSFLDGPAGGYPAGTSAGGYRRDLIRSELLPLLRRREDFQAGGASGASGGAMHPAMALGAPESGLGVMLAALGCRDLAAQAAPFGLEVERLLLERRTVNTGVLLFDTGEASRRGLWEDAVRVSHIMDRRQLVLHGDMHVFGLLLLLAHPAASLRDFNNPAWGEVLVPLPVSWNWRFNRNHAQATLGPSGELSFEYGVGPSASAGPPHVAPPSADTGRAAAFKSTAAGTAATAAAADQGGLRLVHFTWAKPWDPKDKRDAGVWDDQRRRMAEQWGALSRLVESAEGQTGATADATADARKERRQPGEAGALGPAGTLELGDSATETFPDGEAAGSAQVEVVAELGGVQLTITRPSPWSSVAAGALLKVDVALEVTQGPAAEQVRQTNPADLHICRGHALGDTLEPRGGGEIIDAQCSRVMDGAQLPPIRIEKGFDLLPEGPPEGPLEGPPEGLSEGRPMKREPLRVGCTRQVDVVTQLWDGGGRFAIAEARVPVCVQV